MTLIREDKHGIYCKAGGNLFRPIKMLYSSEWPRANVINKPEDSKLKAGDKVKAHHISTTSMGQVGYEVWHSHGNYFDAETQKHLPSEDLLYPKTYEERAAAEGW